MANGNVIPKESQIINEILQHHVKPQDYGAARALLLDLVRASAESANRIAAEVFIEACDSFVQN